MTAPVAKRFAQAVLTTTPAAVYTVPASTIGVLRDMQLCNFGGADKTVSVWFVLSGGSTANASLVLPASTIAGTGGATTVFYRHMFAMAAGDMIYASAQTNTYVTLQASGVELTSTQGIVPTRLIQTDLPNSSTLQYTVTAGKTVIVKDLLLANHDGSNAHTVTIDVVKSGGSVGNASKFLYTYSIAGSVQTQFRLSLALEAGDTIYAHADSANKVSMNVSGGVITL